MKETEEIIEVRLMEMLAAAVPDMDVVGALSPVPEGEQKKSADTYISVFVDLASQDLDWRGASVPCSYTASVTIHYANADDATGTGFRDACRCVRRVFHSLTGDGCEGLDGEGFRCDQFLLDSTETALDRDADVGGTAKTYNATIVGRYSHKENS